MEPIKLILVDDHRIFLEGLKELLEQQPSVKVVTTAENGKELFIKMQSYHVDVVILDIQMPKMNGIATALEIQQRYPEVRMLMLSMHSDKTFVQRVFDIGVHGFLTKTVSKKELLEAIREVYMGRKYFRADAAFSFLDRNRSATRTLPGAPTLSKRETEVLILIAKEHSNRDIATMLHLSVETVNTHRKNLLQKLGAKNTAGLVKYAIYKKLIAD